MSALVALIPRAELVVDAVVMRSFALKQLAELVLSPDDHAWLARQLTARCSVLEVKGVIGAEAIVAEYAAARGVARSERSFKVVELAQRIAEEHLESRWSPLLVRPLRCVSCGRWGYHLRGCSRGGRR